MTVRVVVVAMAAVATSLLTCACASRGAGSGAASGSKPASGVVDTFTRSGPAIQPSTPRTGRTGPTCALGANGTAFAFSSTADAKGYVTPLQAAVEFSRDNDQSVPPTSAAKWKVVTSGATYSFRSDTVVVSVVRLKNRSWIVDSGTICG